MPPKSKTKPNTSHTTNDSMNSTTTRQPRKRTQRNVTMEGTDEHRNAKLTKLGLNPKSVLDAPRHRQPPPSVYTPEASRSASRSARKPKNAVLPPQKDVHAFLKTPIITIGKIDVVPPIHTSGKFGVIATFVGSPIIMNLVSLKYVKLGNSPEIFDVHGYKNVSNVSQIYEFLASTFQGITCTEGSSTNIIVLYQRVLEEPPMLSGMKHVRDLNTAIPNISISHHMEQYTTPARSRANSKSLLTNVIKKADVEIDKPLFEHYLNTTFINPLGAEKAVTMKSFLSNHGYVKHGHIDLGHLMHDYLLGRSFFEKFIVTDNNIGASNVKVFLPQFAEFIKVLERFRHTHNAMDDIASRMGRMTIATPPPSATRPASARR